VKYILNELINLIQQSNNKILGEARITLSDLKLWNMLDFTKVHSILLEIAILVSVLLAELE